MLQSVSKIDRCTFEQLYWFKRSHPLQLINKYAFSDLTAACYKTSYEIRSFAIISRDAHNVSSIKNNRFWYSGIIIAAILFAQFESYKFEKFIIRRKTSFEKISKLYRCFTCSPAQVKSFVILINFHFFYQKNNLFIEFPRKNMKTIYLS